MKITIIIFTLLFSVNSIAQKSYAKQILDSLCGQQYSGRGYVNNGVNLAANFLVNELKKIGVKNYPNQNFRQYYKFNVNTFPNNISVKFNNNLLKIGKDYILNSNSGSANGTYNVIELNSTNFLNTDSQPKNGKTVVVYNFTNLKNRDSIRYVYHMAMQTSKVAPVIWIQKSKLMYSVGRSEINNPMIVVIDSIYKKPTTITLNIKNKFISNFSNQNIIGYIPSSKKCKLKKEKLIVLTAHYDHLGKMGQAMFPGANDNASGVAMLLSLAKKYIKTKNKYGLVFCFFSGEEAGLEGSKYFVSHPYFKLKQVKFVLNIDIMGGASKGITVVNGTKHKKEFSQLTKINLANKYLNEVKKRGPTANSDHYYFSENNVPAFFIYSGGKVKNYHDIFDTAENTPLNKFTEVENLLFSFINYF